MKKASSKTLMLSIILAAFLAGLYACAADKTVTRHPEPGSPVCGACHTDDRAAMSHTGDFIGRHQFYSGGQAQVCYACHKTSFCNDCHSNREELKPSDKFKDSPERALPHRGDYITRHKIDGKINPAPCFDCHGRRNNERCLLCHK